MKILSIDTSSSICSVAILEDENIIYEKTIEDALTHSQKLMPMIEEAFLSTNLSLKDIDLYACNVGPGSFTGIRIGISTIKAFVDVYQKPCVGISSLESLAYLVSSPEGIICSLLDAKNENVYGGIYEYRNGTYSPIQDLFACSIEECIKEHLQAYTTSSIHFAGDGATTHMSLLKETFSHSTFEENNKQNAVLVGKAALFHYFHAIESPISPLYLRKSQAERMLENKKNEYKD